MESPGLVTTVQRAEPAASDAAIAMAETELGVIFPAAYRDLLKWANGGEFDFGNAYVEVWDTVRIVKRNQSYEIPSRLPGIVGIGSDGGDECYALDFRLAEQRPLVRVSLGALRPEFVETIGPNLIEGLRNLPTLR